MADGEMGGCAIAVMAKVSRPGRTKTRLCPPLSLSEAADFNTAFLHDILANLRAAGREAPITAHLAFGPPDSRPFFEALAPDGVGLIETWLPNFGDCLFHAVTSLLADGHAAACVLNSDSPTLPTSFLVRAAHLLAAPGERAVLGPSSDGGYYLLGVKAAHRRLFDDIDWSTERVAAQTRERAAEIGLELHLLPTWYDVDDREALRILHGECFEARPFGGTDAALNPADSTRALIKRLMDKAGLRERLGLSADAARLPVAERMPT